MPEGHTLHRLAQALDAAFAGTRPRAGSPQGRFAEGAALIDAQEVVRASAWGKHLFVEYVGGRFLNVHLGLIGKFSVEGYDASADGPPPVWGQVRLRLLTDTHVADLRGATVCQVVTRHQVEEITARLGPDPLRTAAEGTDPEAAWKRISKSGRAFGELLMDQSILAGVGNVYRCEVLFRHRISPFRPGKQIRRETWQVVWDDLIRLMPLGVAFNQIITMPDQVEEAEQLVEEGRVPELTSTYTDSARRAAAGPAGVLADPARRIPARPGAVLAESARRALAGPAGVLAAAVSEESAADLADEDDEGLVGEDDEDSVGDEAVVGPAGFERRYFVYRRQGLPCRVCGSKIRTKIVAGRNLFWCGRCQRRR